ncbi:MAG: hypothetical protein OIF48_00960 [Silicimonas sp.]|nr:hypothetical protein [Silicimonas sp.]
MARAATLGLVACLPAVAVAQGAKDPRSYITDLWQVYQSRCGLALENPQRFLETLPATNARGGPNAVMTPDQTLLISSTAHNSFVVDVEFIAVPGGMNLSCHVNPSESRYAELYGVAAAEIEQALKHFATVQGLGQLSGGEIGNAFTGPQDGEIIEYHYPIAIAMSGISVLTRFEFMDETLAVFFEGVTVPSDQ